MYLACFDVYIPPLKNLFVEMCGYNLMTFWKSEHQCLCWVALHEIELGQKVGSQ